MKSTIPHLTPQQKAQILGDPRPQPSPNAPAGVSNPLAALHTLCADSPRRLISLWDMNQIIAREFLAAWLLLERAFAKAQKGNQQQLATEAERGALVVALIEVHYQFGRMGLAQSKGLANEFLEQLQNPAWHRDRIGRQAVLQGLPIPPMPKEAPLPSFAMIYSQLRGIVGQARDEMDAIRMAVVFKDQAQFFEQDALFGAEFHKAASVEMNSEIKAAGNCLAADLPTAAVFHLIRAAEFGLREFVTHIKADRRLSQSLEESDWHQLIEAAEKEVDTLAAKNFKKRCRTALSEFRILKDEWRNNVMHTRGSYTEHAAMDIYCRVRDFLPRLQRYLKVN